MAPQFPSMAYQFYRQSWEIGYEYEYRGNVGCFIKIYVQIDHTRVDAEYYETPLLCVIFRPRSRIFTTSLESSCGAGCVYFEVCLVPVL